MNKDVFRQTALDQVTAPDSLDEILTVTTPGDWIGVAAIALLVASLGVWSTQGRISRKVTGQGVLVLAGGVVNVASEGSGRVRDVRVKNGDQIAVNQVIGSIAQPELEDRLKTLRQNLAELQREAERAGGARTEGLRLQGVALTNQRDNFRREIRDFEQQIQVVNEQVATEEELLAKGLITRQQVLATRQKRTVAEAGIANVEAQLKQLDSNQFMNQAQANTADREAVGRIEELQRSIEVAEKELATATVVRSPFAGKVIELKVYAGGLVNRGEPFLSMEPSTESFAVIAYVPAGKAKDVHVGMPVEIAPASVRREEFGFMRGHVTSVAEFPATQAAVMRNFENESLVSALATGGPVHEVRVELERDPKTASGFQWSSSQGPPMKITSGTLCAAAITTYQQTPLSLVVPFLKSAAGMN